MRFNTPIRKNYNLSLLFIGLSFLLAISGCSSTIAPADEAKLAKGNFSDLDASFTPLTIGQAVPLFTLPDADGTQISLAEVNKEQAVLLVFYRGDWCPYCIDQLSSISALLPQIEALGVQVIGISPDTQASAKNTQRRFGQQFIFLSDPQANVIGDYGIARANKLPHPAVYLVSKKGKLLWFYASMDHKKRPNGEQLLAVIKSHIK